MNRYNVKAVTLPKDHPVFPKAEGYKIYDSRGLPNGRTFDKDLNKKVDKFKPGYLYTLYKNKSEADKVAEKLNANA